MKKLLPVLCLSLVMFCGCTTGFIRGSFHLLGAKRGHQTTCYVEDSPTNRLALAAVITSVGVQHGLHNNTASWRERLVRFGKLGYDTNGCIVSFVSTNNAGQPVGLSGITIHGYEHDGKLRAWLHQEKYSKKRSKEYAQIHDSLVAAFRERFGSETIVHESAEVRIK